MISMSREEELEELVNQAQAEGRDLGAEAKAVVEEIEEEQRVDRDKALTVKDKLRRRLLSGYLDIPLDGPDGPFNIRMMIPEPAERQRFIRLQMETERIIDNPPVDVEQVLIRLDAEMCSIIGAHCPDLDAEYIQAGKGFGVDIIGQLMNVITGIRPVNMENYRFFRSPSDRKA